MSNDNRSSNLDQPLNSAYEPEISKRELARITNAIDVAFVAADDKLIGSKWDLDTANIVCNGLSDAQYLTSVIERLQAEVIAARSAIQPVLPAANVYAPPAGVCYTKHYTNKQDDGGEKVFVAHKANPDGAPACGSRYERQPYMPDAEYEFCERCYPPSGIGGGLGPIFVDVDDTPLVTLYEPIDVQTELVYLRSRRFITANDCLMAESLFKCQIAAASNGAQLAEISAQWMAQLAALKAVS